jgi:hypothetical protein
MLGGVAVMLATAASRRAFSLAVSVDGVQHALDADAPHAVAQADAFCAAHDLDESDCSALHGALRARLYPSCAAEQLELAYEVGGEVGGTLVFTIADAAVSVADEFMRLYELAASTRAKVLVPRITARMEQRLAREDYLTACATAAVTFQANTSTTVAATSAALPVLGVPCRVSAVSDAANRTARSLCQLPALLSASLYTSRPGSGSAATYVMLYDGETAKAAASRHCGYGSTVCAGQVEQALQSTLGGVVQGCPPGFSSDCMPDICIRLPW